MKWVNHIIVGGSLTAIVEPSLVPVAVIGSIAPDWLEGLANKVFNAGWQHRKQTHYISVWFFLMCFFFFVIDFNYIFTAFCFGGLTHLILDSFTVSGVPLHPYSDRRFHLFGGRLSTGGRQEYFLSFGVLFVSVFIILLTNNYATGGGFVPFFYNWGEMYHAGIIDASEYKANRFRLF